jgi:hypothetical protein
LTHVTSTHAHHDFSNCCRSIYPGINFHMTHFWVPTRCQTLHSDFCPIKLRFCDLARCKYYRYYCTPIRITRTSILKKGHARYAHWGGARNTMATLLVDVSSTVTQQIPTSRDFREHTRTTYSSSSANHNLTPNIHSARKLN